MRRPILLSAVLMLFLVAGVSLIAGGFLVPSPPLPASATADLDVVRRFYAAVNETIATGDTSALHTVVAPHFVDQDPVPGMRPDRGGLEAYLAALHLSDPDLEVVVEAVVGADNRAIARVGVRGGQGLTHLGTTAVDQFDPWGTVDTFRIAGHSIVERWSQTDDLALVQPIAEAALDLPSPSPRVVTIERLTMVSGASWNPAPAGPRLLFLEDGVLHVDVEVTTPARESLAPIADGSTVAELEARPSPLVATLSAGESSVVPADAHVAATNIGATRLISWR